jgi:hypothetical protein
VALSTVRERGNQHFAAFEHTLDFQAQELVTTSAEGRGGCLALALDQLMNLHSQRAFRDSYQPPWLHQPYARCLMCRMQQASQRRFIDRFVAEMPHVTTFGDGAIDRFALSITEARVS